MNESTFELTDETRRAASAAWFAYLERLDPFRADLFRYCRKLTGDLWDAEDLVQDTLEQGFAKLGSVHHEISNPRAYMLRIASNLWIDGIRRRQAEAAALSAQGSDPTQRSPHPPDASDTIGVRDAGAALLHKLAPQERAALVLKDVFDLSLEETASALGTSVGAIKSALHRGRSALNDPLPPGRRNRPDTATIERFVERYNQRDLPGLLALMLEDASIEAPGLVLEQGRAGFERERGWFHHNFFDPIDDKPTTAVWQLAEFCNEPVVLVLYEHRGGRVLGSLMRMETDDGLVSRIRVYALCPDAVGEVATALGLPQSPLRLYRFPFALQP